MVAPVQAGVAVVWLSGVWLSGGLVLRSQLPHIPTSDLRLPRFLAPPPLGWCLPGLIRKIVDMDVLITTLKLDRLCIGGTVFGELSGLCGPVFLWGVSLAAMRRRSLPDGSSVVECRFWSGE